MFISFTGQHVAQTTSDVITDTAYPHPNVATERMIVKIALMSAFALMVWTFPNLLLYIYKRNFEKNRWWPISRALFGIVIELSMHYIFEYTALLYYKSSTYNNQNINMIRIEFPSSLLHYDNRISKANLAHDQQNSISIKFMYPKLLKFVWVI